jgi:hypothetical protein
MPLRSFVLGVISVAAGAACAETRRPLGEACIKDDDCLSGVCAAQQCAARPPLLDAQSPATADAGPAGDALVDSASLVPDAEAADVISDQGGG